MNFLLTHGYHVLLEELQNMPPASSRSQAYTQFMHACARIESRFTTDARAVAELRDRPLSPQSGWHDIDKDPCYWQDQSQPNTRIYIHDSGQLLIQEFKQGQSVIAFSSPLALLNAAPPPQALAEN